MLHIVGHLFRASSFGLVDGALHGVCDFVGIHYYFAVHISCGTPCGLCQRSVVAQKSLFVGVENGHEAYLRQVETFSEQVDADEYVVDTLTQIFENAYAFQGVDIAV